MLKKIVRNFMLFSMIFMLNNSMVESAAYATDLNNTISSNTTSDTSTETKKGLESQVSSNNTLNENSKNSLTTVADEDNKKDEKSNDKAADNLTDKENEEFIAHGWKTIGNKNYYLVDNKILENTGWFMESDVNPDIDEDDENYESEYYLDKDFSMVIGWKKIKSDWYYFNSKGVLQKDNWLLDSNWYYLDDSGRMLTDWQKIDGHTYYFNQYGQMSIGKKLINNNWYFFNDKGQLQTKFYNYKGKIYYSDENGIIVTNKWIETRKNKYYIKSDSSIATGDIFINGVMEKFSDNGFYKNSDIAAKSDLYIHYLNVGNADCAFIKLPSGETVLIDTGDTTTTKTLIDFLNTQNLKTELFESEKDGQAPTKTTTTPASISFEAINEKDTDTTTPVDSSLEAIEENGIDTTADSNTSKGVIDYVILTHPHSDHIGGMIELMKNFKIGKVIIPKYFDLKDYSPGATSIDEDKINIIKYDYEIYTTTMDALSKSGLPIVEAEPDAYIDSENILQFLHINKDYSKLEKDTFYSEYGSFNDNSAIVYLNYHDLQALFTADIQWNAEKDFFNRGALDGNQVDILKVPHHGNVGSSSYTFIGYTKPTIGIISRAKEAINTTNEPYDVLTTCGVNIYETSATDGVSVYATKDNWNLEAK